MLNSVETPFDADYFTVEEASRQLTCAQPVRLDVLRQLGYDCTTLCRLRRLPTSIRNVSGKGWATEKTYPPEIVREVFLMNPNTRAYIPK